MTGDGVPTQRYTEYRNHAASKQILGEAIKETYSDIFLIAENPTASDRNLIEGKFKSYHNTSDVVAALMTKTFYALLELADISGGFKEVKKPKKVTDTTEDDEINDEEEKPNTNSSKPKGSLGLHYNIQVHLPATKDVEVYNAIFKSLKNHLLE